MDVKVFQFNGCNKCFNESILLKGDSEYNVELISDPKNWKEEKTTVAIITGYLLFEDKPILEKIQSNSEEVIAYGNCSTMGGVFALANQHGHGVAPLDSLIKDPVNIDGCLGEIEELKMEIAGEEAPKLQHLCTVCGRKKTCDYLDEVKRQIDLEDEGTCFNDLGFLCNGFIAKECKERCIDYGAPCRGCKPMVDRSGIRMLGLFGTLMGNIEVATEHSEKGATDKLADPEDDVTRSLPDVVGNFFRFTLPTSGLPRGRIPSSGTLIEDVFTGRLIEELPLISGLLGGDNWISLTLKIIDTYEQANGIEISEQTKKYRTELLELEKQLQNAIKNEDSEQYKQVTNKIRKIGGNMNLSNVFYGGFKSQIDEKDNFDDYKIRIFDVVEGTYKNGSVEYSIDPEGIVKEIKIREG
ncbi:MAG: NADH-quinone oxidoreductase subunit B family protein [Promethearchaeota archaeon]|jgi:coenzyme F420-reducing hydrogenase gamma subunit